jgi:hypothetical protein
MRERVQAYVVSAVVLACVAWPVVRHPLRDDSFPLSTYPMFSRPRPKPVLSANYALRVDADGERHHLSPRYIANGEVLQARAILDRTVGSKDRRRLRQLCEDIAERVARWDHPAKATVRIVRGTHDAVEYLTGRDTRGRERIHIECPVRKSP